MEELSQKGKTIILASHDVSEIEKTEKQRKYSKKQQKKMKKGYGN
ncbi:hypothetical protein [Marinitoga sp. 1155]|nr:hypothetical protein [Marinitoga sp. 1155]